MQRYHKGFSRKLIGGTVAMNKRSTHKMKIMAAFVMEDGCYHVRECK